MKEIRSTYRLIGKEGGGHAPTSEDKQKRPHPGREKQKVKV